MRRGFTLLELLVIVAIMGSMVTVGLVSVNAGQGAARVKGATRDIFAAIRQARSVALVTQQPAVITYSTAEVDEQPVAKVEITSAKLFAATVDRSKIETVTGEPLPGSMIADAAAADDGAADGETGETLEDVLFAPIDSEIVKGMRLKVVIGEELGEVTAAHRSKVSIFSNVDYILGRYRDAKASAAKQSETAATDDQAEVQEPVSVVWETNGRVEPHQVYVYADGKRPEDGLLIKIDPFGGAKVVAGDGREE